MKIVTHNVKFHTDDVFAVATLLIKYPGSEVARTRDEELIKTADIVVDVGGVYDPEKNLFDHHQPGGAGVRESGVPYASFGLVWKKFGEELCGSKEVAERIDFRIIQTIDAGDVGMDLFTSSIPQLHPYSIIGLTDLFRPTWQEGEDYDGSFRRAVSWAQGVLERIIKIEKDNKIAQEIIVKAYNNSINKNLIIVDSEIPLGREIVNGVLSNYPEPIYAVLFRKDHQSWQLLAINKDSSTYTCRKYLPESWRSKSGEELEKATGVPGSIFCHSSGFMCVAKTKEGALELAQIALRA